MLFLSGTFWHITDLHWDPTYKLNDNPDLVCASSGTQPAVDAGKFGDYACDSPFHLINSSVYAMKAILPDPDFIIWTGYVSDCWLLHFNTNLAQQHITVDPPKLLLTFFFILSDDTPHVPNEDLGTEAVLSIISNLTHIIRQVFPCKYTVFFL